jgi:hypothetical protein
MLHEILHTLGAVPTCAPHHHRAGHVSDRTDDIMWAGTGAWQVPGHLDPGRDDYYGHGRSDCFDLARSPYLTSNAPPPPPVLAAGRPVLSGLRAGATLTATLRVTLDGVPAASARPRCAARVAGRPLRLASSALPRGTVTCRWKLPRTAAGRRVTGTIGASANGRSVSRGFSASVR